MKTHRSLGNPCLSFVLAGLITALGTGAQAGAGESREGERLARQWCTACHLVNGGIPATDAAPPFATLAADPTRTESYLRAWISQPHPPMPDFSMTRREVDDLLAYIATLAPAPDTLR